ncbi:MAG: hypothetical protein M1334_04000 [Patescibacteria group bacterium]|nr:hypothetical protein [Patescibacteria group bacterium]
MVIQSWTDVVVSSLQGLWITLVGFLPALIGALIVLIIGLIVAAGLGALVEKVFDVIKLDSFLAKIGLEPYFQRAGLKLRGSRFLGRLVYWFIVIAFLLAASDILGFYSLSAFIRDVLMYIPNVIMAVLIMLAALVAGNFTRKAVKASVMSSKLHGANFLATVTWYAFIVFGFFAALTQLDVATSIVNAVVTAFVAMIALAGGLAFGLGGREYAAHLISKFKEHIEG